MIGDGLALVDDQLRATMIHVERAAAGRWRVRVGPCVVQVRVRDDWLLLDEAPGARSEACLRLLIRNATTGGPAAYVLFPDGLIRASCAVALTPGVDVRRRIDEAIAAIAAGRRSSAAARSVPVDDATLRAITTAGWRVRSGARAPEIDLGEPAPPRGASVEAYDDGSTRFAVRLAERLPDAVAPRAAVARLVLSCGASVRGIHGEAAGCDGGMSSATPRVVASFASPPSPEEIGHAASALALARDRYAPAVQALSDTDIAREYLAAGGAGRSPAPLHRPRSRSAAHTSNGQEAQP